MKTHDKSLEIYDSNFKIKYKLKYFVKENKIYTNDWENGFYYIRLKYNGTYYYGKVKVSH